MSTPKQQSKIRRARTSAKLNEYKSDELKKTFKRANWFKMSMTKKQLVKTRLARLRKSKRNRGSTINKCTTKKVEKHIDNKKYWKAKKCRVQDVIRAGQKRFPGDGLFGWTKGAAMRSMQDNTLYRAKRPSVQGCSRYMLKNKRIPFRFCKRGDLQNYYNYVVRSQNYGTKIEKEMAKHSRTMPKSSLIHWLSVNAPGGGMAYHIKGEAMPVRGEPIVKGIRELFMKTEPEPFRKDEPIVKGEDMRELFDEDEVDWMADDEKEEDEKKGYLARIKGLFGFGKSSEEEEEEEEEDEDEGEDVDEFEKFRKDDVDKKLKDFEKDSMVEELFNEENCSQDIDVKELFTYLQTLLTSYVHRNAPHKTTIISTIISE